MKERKFPVIFFSLFFAFLVWTSINLGNVFQISIEVPVRIENLRIDQAIAVPLPSAVRFKIEGTGWQLLNTLITPNLHYTIDFSLLSRKDFLYTSQELSEHVNLSKAIHIFETSPETIVVRLDDKISKKVMVAPEVNFSFREGFGIVGSMKTVPDSIVLTGARSLLNRFHAWKTKSITLNDINSPVSLNLILTDTLQFEITRPQTKITISFDVQPIAEKTITDVPLEILQVPENRNIVLIPPTISIIIRSGVNTITPLGSKDFHAFIDYKTILLDTSGTVKPYIISPADVKIVQQNPEQIQYVIRK